MPNFKKHATVSLIECRTHACKNIMNYKKRLIRSLCISADTAYGSENVVKIKLVRKTQCISI